MRTLVIIAIVIAGAVALYSVLGNNRVHDCELSGAVTGLIEFDLARGESRDQIVADGVATAACVIAVEEEQESDPAR
jgi:hypothetical protein